MHDGEAPGQLPGGLINAVIRVDETVRRPQSPQASFVHRVLEHLGHNDWAGAPRFLGVDSEGREILSYLDGHAAWQPAHQRQARCDASLRRLSQLVREFHDLTAGTNLAAGHEVVCHNDLSPKNTIYRNLDTQPQPVAFIDWDLAAPGLRIHDIAHVCWQYLDLGHSVIDTDESARLIRLICDSYGLPDRTALMETILWWQDRCWRGIEAAATAGDPTMIRLRDTGASEAIRTAHDWVAHHRRALENRIA